jgi:hypothetical protein
VTGSKTFSYLLLPKEQGPAPIANSLYWVYFNVKEGRYDTLRPQTVLQVRKGKKASAGNSARSEDSFYSLLENADNHEIDLSERKSGSLLWYNLAMAVMAAVSLFFMFRKR